MKEFYKTDHGVLYHGDCVPIIEMLDILGDKIDLVVTSPPYDNLRKYKGYSFDFENTAKRLSELINRGSVIIWVVGDATQNGSESGTSFKQALYFKEECGLNIHDTMIYRKLNYTPLTHRRYEQEWEYMFCFSKDKPKVFNPIKIPCKYAGQKTWGQPNIYKDSSGDLTKIKQIVIKDTKIKGNIFEYLVGSTKTGKIKHPAMFPEQLVYDQITTWSNVGDTVLDPFMGSGTTAFVSEQLGRKWIGCEISTEYCEIIAKRLDSLKTDWDWGG